MAPPSDPMEPAEPGTAKPPSAAEPDPPQPGDMFTPIGTADRAGAEIEELPSKAIEALDDDDNDSDGLSEDAVVEMVPIRRLPTRPKPTAILAPDEVRRYDADPDSEGPKASLGPIEARVRKTAEDIFRDRYSGPPRPPIVMPAVADPTATGAYTSRQLAQAIKDEDAEASDWFKPESEQETVPNPPPRPIRVTGFAMNTNETETPAARSNRSVIAGLITVATAVVAIAACAGITIGLPTVGWLGGAFGGDEPEVVVVEAAPIPPTTDQGPVPPDPVIVDAPVDVAPIPDPAAVVTAVDDDPTWLRCAPPDSENPSPTYNNGDRREFLAMQNDLTVLEKEHMVVLYLQERAICASGTPSDFEIAETAIFGSDGVCKTDTTDDGVANPTPDTSLHVEWLCSDQKGKLVGRQMLWRHLSRKLTPVAELTGIKAKCCDDGGVDHACELKPEPKTVASNP